MDKVTRSHTIGLLVQVLEDDAKAIAATAAEVGKLLSERNQDGAIAELMLADVAINRSRRTYRLVMSLHRDA